MRGAVGEAGCAVVYMWGKGLIVCHFGGGVVGGGRRVEQNGELGMEFEVRDRKVLGSAAPDMNSGRGFPAPRLRNWNHFSSKLYKFNICFLIRNHLWNKSRE